jgi:CyaY protein
MVEIAGVVRLPLRIKLGFRHIIWQDNSLNVIKCRITVSKMTESEFLQYSDDLFGHIEESIDAGGWSLDCETSGNVLTIEADSGAQIIVNRHAATQELWIAAKSGGYHFACQQGQWLSARDGSEFFAILSQVLSAACGDEVHIPVLN